MTRRGFGDDPSSRVLDQLELMEGFLRETKEERITVVNAGGNKTVYKDGGRVGGEGGKKTINAA